MKIKSLFLITVFYSCQAFAQSDSSFCSLFRAVLANHEIVTYMGIDTAHLEKMKLIDRKKQLKNCLIGSGISIIDTSGRFILFTPNYYAFFIQKDKPNEIILHIFYYFLSHTAHVYFKPENRVWILDKFEFGEL